MAKDDVKPTASAPSNPNDFVMLRFRESELMDGVGVVRSVVVKGANRPFVEDNSLEVNAIRKVTGGFDIEYEGLKIENRRVANSNAASVASIMFIPFSSVRVGIPKVA